MDVTVCGLICAALDTPHALSVAILAQNGEWDQLALRSSDPSLFLDTISGAHLYYCMAQSNALYNKREDLPTSFDRESAAYDSFFAAELLCTEMNLLLTRVSTPLISDPEIIWSMHGIASRAGKWIKRVMGDLPDKLDGRFGPGQVIELRGSSTFSTVLDKMLVEPAVTRQARAIYHHTLDHQGGWTSLMEEDLHTSVVRGNVFTTVPKNAKTNRGICIEPGGNVYCQLAVGSHLKRRLAAVGLHVAPSKPVDLADRVCGGRWNLSPSCDGQVIHRRLARMGSVDGSLATIDLSAASDTISTALVRLLVTDDSWYSLLSDLRSPVSWVERPGGSDGRYVLLEKFSSMGNGFTFELLSLLIAGLIHGVTGLLPGSDFWVYGDDVIVPNSFSKDVLSCLQAFGFKVNRTKSFTTGLFRESCGGDYFCGVDVRPKFLGVAFTGQEPIVIMDWHNSLLCQPTRAWARVRVALRKLVPSPLRLCDDATNLPVVFHTRAGRCVRKREDEINYLKGLILSPQSFTLARWGFRSWRSIARYLLTGSASPGIGVRRGEDLDVGLKAHPCSNTSVVVPRGRDSIPGTFETKWFATP